jgi:integrase
MYINTLAGLSEETIKKYQQVLYRFFQTATWAGHTLRNPVFDIRLPKCRPTIHRRRITGKEREMILQLAEHHPMGLYIKVMLYCGLRTMEVAALDGRHIDLSKRLIHVRQAVKTDGTIGEPKSRAGKRDIPIPDALLRDLQRLDLQPYAPAIPHHGRSGPTRYTETTVKSGWRDFKKQLAKMGPVAPDLCLYDLRHTYCTDLEAAGVPINIARDLMGHASVTVTSRVYTHRTEESLERARDLIDDFQREKTGENTEKDTKMCQKRDI